MPASGPKGIGKRQDHLFKPGNEVWRKRPGSAGSSQHQRPADDQKPDSQKSAKGGASITFESDTARRLRPKRHGEPEIENEMRLVKQNLVNQMWNESIAEHSRKSKKCIRPNFTQAREVKWGLAVSQSLKCKNCRFVSKSYKLYDEVRLTLGKGRKAAVPNVALGAALENTTIGIEKARDILSALDLPLPSASAMQKLAVHVSKTTKKVAERGCAEKLKLVAGKDKKVKIKVDARYNTSRYTTNRRTGLHQTSQAITVAMEDDSGENYIVATNIQNKICVVGTRMALKGIDVQCPGHDGCTASVRRLDSLSEKVAGEDIGRQIRDQGITVTHITTDGDAQCAKGVQEVTPTPIQKLKCKNHLAQRQKFKGQGVVWSNKMFPGVTTVGKKSQCAQALAHDLKRRSVTVLHALHEKHKGKLKDIQREAKKSVGAIITCYQGDCVNCQGKIVTGCLGGKGGELSWVTVSQVLADEKIDCLQMTRSDVRNMTEVLNKMLDEEALDSTQLLTDTQANEAFNRILSSTSPKNVKYSRTLEGRTYAAVEHSNQGPGKARFRLTTELGLPTTKGQLRHLQGKQERHMWKKAYNKSPKTIQRRAKCDYYLRGQKRIWKQGILSDYAKEQHAKKPEHAYCKVSTHLPPIVLIILLTF